MKYIFGLKGFGGTANTPGGIIMILHKMVLGGIGGTANTSPIYKNRNRIFHPMRFICPKF